MDRRLADPFRMAGFQVFTIVLSLSLQAAASRATEGGRPIRKVITLLEEMKAQVEKEASADQQAYEKYECWCTTTEAEKSAAIDAAKTTIEEHTAFIQESAATAGGLKTEIDGLESDVGEDKDALATATAVREKELRAFLADEADTKETRKLLGEAVGTLSKVQLTQRHSHTARAARQAATALIQVRDIARRRRPHFQGLMERDLFDMLGSLQGLAAGSEQTSDFRGGASAARRDASALAQAVLRAKPNKLVGKAAGAKSYNSRSGSILGVLSEMQDQFSRDLAAAQKTDLEAEIAFQKLRATKLTEISSAGALSERKEAALSELLDKSAKAKKDKVATEKALAADEEFLASMQETCKSEAEDYKQRVADRTEEIRALAEALTILSSDSARSLYGKTMSLVQVESARAASRQRRALDELSQRMAEMARRHGDRAMASLVAHMRLDSFTKVKAVMDKMLADLQKQQKEEYEKAEFCKKEIDATEDSIKESTIVKQDLASKHQLLKNTIETLQDEIAGLQKDVKEMEGSLKRAGEERKAQSKLFQASIADQRATVRILHKALARLKTFYSFAQASGRGLRTRGGLEQPGAPPPPSGKSFQKSAAAGGVLQLLAMVIKDAERTEQDLHASEQKSQSDYSLFVKDAAASLRADRTAVKQKEAQVADAKSGLSETEEAQLANGEELTKLSDLLKARHLECDFVLKFFDVRQQARGEEMDAIKEAKAILSGANFGQ